MSIVARNNPDTHIGIIYFSLFLGTSPLRLPHSPCLIALHLHPPCRSRLNIRCGLVDPLLCVAAALEQQPINLPSYSVISKEGRIHWQFVQMAYSELSLRTSRSLSNLTRDMRSALAADPPLTTILPPEPDSVSPLDGYFVAHPLHLDLYSPIASPSTRQSPHTFRIDPNPSPPLSLQPDNGGYLGYRHQRKSSTASLAEFLKTTGPDDIRVAGGMSTNVPNPTVSMTRSLSPIGNRKKSNFLLKFAVGKSGSMPKKEESLDISPMTSKSTTEVTTASSIAQPQFTAAGRKYYAIKVDYPYTDDQSISTRPLLFDSPTEPKGDSRSEMDLQAVMKAKKHHRLSSVLASETSMEFLNDAEGTPRSSGRYSSYPPSRGRNSLVRSNSLSEFVPPSDSLLDESSILPGDSISLRPARTTINSGSSTHPRSAAYNHGPTEGKQPVTSYVSTAAEGKPDPILSSERHERHNSTASTDTMELMNSLDMLDKLRKSKTASESDSAVSFATTRSIQQRRRAKKLAQQSTSVDETRRLDKLDSQKKAIRPIKSTADLNKKGLPLLPPHQHSQTAPIQRARAAAAAAALSPRAKRSQQRVPSTSTTKVSQHMPHKSSETFIIPEDDTLSLRSGISAYRSQRREKVRDKRQKDLDDERSRKLDEAMRLLQKDVQRKREALDRQDAETITSIGSQTPRQMPSIERLRTPPTTPPHFLPSLKTTEYSLSPISILVDCSPSGERSVHFQPEPLPPPPSSSRIFTNPPITPISSAPSSPTKAQYDNVVRQPIPQKISLPPNYPPPNPIPNTRGKKLSSTTEDEDLEQRIAALEEQKWVLEQALRVLLNQQNGVNSPGTSPLMGYTERATTKSKS